MTAWSIRLSEGTDVAALLALQSLCFPPQPGSALAWSSAALAAHLRGAGQVVTQADRCDADQGADGGRPAGFLIGRWTVDEAEVLSLGVAPDCRRSGLGRGLVDDFLRRAATAGVRQCYLDVAANNHAASNLYEAMGFVVVGRRKGYYNHDLGLPVDALLLCKTL